MTDLYFQHPNITCDDIDSICCVCFADEDVLSLTRNMWNDRILVDILQGCSPLQDFSADWYPPNICSNCIADLIFTYIFLNKISSSYYIVKSKITDLMEIAETEADFNPKPVTLNETSESICTDEIIKTASKYNETTEIESTTETKIKETTEAAPTISYKCNEISEIAVPTIGSKCNKILEPLASTTESKHNETTKTASTNEPKDNRLSDIKSEIKTDPEESNDGSPLNNETIKQLFQIIEYEGINIGSVVKSETIDPSDDETIKVEAVIEGNQTFEVIDDETIIDGKQTLCQLCNKQYYPREYNKHMKLKHPNDVGPLCEECGTLITGQLELHKQYHHKHGSCVCKHCGRDLESLTSLKNHITNKHRNQVRNHVCRICGKRFIKKQTLTCHMITHTKEKRWACHLCGNSFTLPNNLRRHMLSHGKTKPFSCTICGQGFTQSSSLKTHHLNIHLNERRRKCKYCLLVFEDSVKLIHHLKTDHVEEQKLSEEYSQNLQSNSLLCTVCGKKCPCRAILLEHMTIHTGEKKYPCNVCGKRFRLNLSLKQHMLIHTNEKPHQCKRCDKSFRQHAHLKTHQVWHDKTKLHVCMHCNKAFSQKGNLQVHIRTHTGITPHVCRICDKGYSDSNGLKRHLKSQHTLKNELVLTEMTI